MFGHSNFTSIYFQGLQELSIFAKLNFVRGVINVALVFTLIKKVMITFF
jgi:hypothetical protein